jgi:hypothetical protein
MEDFMRQLTAAEIAAARACPTMRVRTAGQIYPGMNRNRCYALMRSGHLEFVTIGRAPYPKTASLERIAAEGLPFETVTLIKPEAAE